MIEITPPQRRALRAQAHALRPVVSVGNAGLTPQVLHEIDNALRAHGLVKVRVFSDDRGEREAMLARIADELDAASVQHIGKLLVLWRPQEESVEEKKPAKVAKPARKRTPPKSVQRQDARRLGPVSRRARGGAAGQETQRHRASTASTNTRQPGASDASQREPRGKSAPNPRRRRLG